MSHNNRILPSSTIPLPPGTIDLTGKEYVDLRVLEYAGVEGDAPHRHAVWLCECTCTAHRKPVRLTVRGTKLRGNLQVSCGGRRADSNVRKAAWITRRNRVE